MASTPDLEKNPDAAIGVATLDRGDDKVKLHPPVRRAARAFWKWPHRNGAVFTIVTLLVLIGTLTSYFVYRAQNEVSRSTNKDNGASDGVVLWGQVQSVDMPTSTLTINWYFAATIGPWLASNVTCIVDDDGNIVAASCPTGGLGTDISVFINGAPTPVYNFSAAVDSNHGVSQFFTTKSIMGSTDPTQTSVVSTSYPFATWQSTILFGAIVTGNRTIAPIYSASIVNNIQNWEIFSEDTASSVNLGSIQIGPTDGRFLHLTIRPAGMVKAFCVLLILAAWCITTVVLYATITLVLFRKQITSAYVTFQASVLFALPAMRNIQPGVPPIGTFADAASLVIQEFLVAFCLVVSVFASIHYPSLPKVA